jgi:ankyrin repeat protein
MTKYLIGLLILGHAAGGAELQALQRTKAATKDMLPAPVCEVSHSWVRDAAHRLSLTCNARQKVILGSFVGTITLGLLVYYHKSCMAKALNFWDFIRRVYHTQHDRDDHLYQHVKTGDLWWAKIWYSRGADINGKIQGESPLHVAAANGDEHMARWLIKNGAEVDNKDSLGRTPLMRTVFNPTAKTQEIVYLLTQHGANRDLQDNLGDTVVHQIAAYPTRATELCLDGVVTSQNINAVNNCDETPLTRALEKRSTIGSVGGGSIDRDLITRIAKYLLEHGAETHAKKGRNVALLRAVEGNFISVVNDMLYAYKDETALLELQDIFYRALACENLDMQRLIFEKIIDIGCKTASAFDVKDREKLAYDFLQEMFKKIFGMDSTTEQGKKALGITVKAFLALCPKAYTQELADWALWHVINMTDEKPYLVGLLMEQGADVNKGHPEELDETPLIRATKLNHLEVVKIVLSKINCIRVSKPGLIELPGMGPVNVVDFRGYSALHYAVQDGHVAIVEALIKAGAESKLEAQDGMTPRKLAEAGGDNNHRIILKLMDDAQKQRHSHGLSSSMFAIFR